MFREQVKLTASAGKTIQSVQATTDEVILVFTDGTFVLLAAEEDIAIEIVDRRATLHGHGSNLVGLGVITQQELNTRRTEEQTRRDRALNDRERETYLRLKAKFEP